MDDFIIRSNEDDKITEEALELSISQRPSLTLDVSRYQSYLDGANLSCEEKAAYLEALWTMIVCFVELGYGIHPLQNMELGNSCEQADEKKKEVLALESPSVLDSLPSTNSKKLNQSGGQ